MSQRFLVILGVILIGGFALIGSSLFVVSETQSAIVLQFGDPRRVVVEPGLHAKVPFVQNVVYLDKRTLNLNAPTEELITRDQRRLVADSFARFRIVDPLRFYTSVNNVDVARTRLGTLINSTLRQVMGSEEFRTVLSDRRADLMRRVRELVNPQVVQFGIQLVDMRIRRADLPDANSQAIFRRMQTDREQEAREYRAQGYEEAQRIRSNADRQRTVLLAEARREAQITRAQGDAEAARIAAETYGRDPKFYAFYRSMEAYRTALTKETTTMVLSPASPFLRFLGSSAGMDEAVAAAPSDPNATPIPIPQPAPVVLPPVPGADPASTPLLIEPAPMMPADGTVPALPAPDAPAPESPVPGTPAPAPAPLDGSAGGASAPAAAPAVPPVTDAAPAPAEGGGAGDAAAPAPQ
ncbi:protease modulator HflC [Zavarzinia sp. CC-PAN008]|uniref:protease modulator HflC n=1 Tax=Zavarzinia sp. CC-PAN008 TaxID=3243332 RepID=UPI003F74664B